MSPHHMTNISRIVHSQIIKIMTIAAVFSSSALFNLLRLNDLFFNKQLAFPWESTVLLFLLTSSLINIRRLTSYRTLKTKKGKKSAVSFIFTFRYIGDVLLLNNLIIGDYVERFYPIGREITFQIQLYLLCIITYI